MPRKTRRSKRKARKVSRRRGPRRTMRGGANNAWRLPKEATVIWRNLQDGEFEDAVPVAMSYEEAREELEL